MRVPWEGYRACDFRGRGAELISTFRASCRNHCEESLRSAARLKVLSLAFSVKTGLVGNGLFNYRTDILTTV